MLEIIAIMILGRRIARMVKAKGHRPGRYIVTMLLLWISLEMLGFVAGQRFFADEVLAYLWAIVGAAIGGYLGYLLAVNAPDINSDEQTLNHNPE